MPATRSKPTGLRAAVGCLLIGGAGLGVNLFGLGVLGQSEMVFGGVGAMLCAYFWGPGWGAAAAGVAASATFWRWGHPAGIMLSVGEAAAIGWLAQRQGWRLVRAAAAYWLVVGIPVVVVYFGMVARFPFPANWAIGIKYPVNGLLVAYAAELLAEGTVVRSWFQPDAPRVVRSLRDHLLRRFGALAVVPVLIVALLAGRRYDLKATAEAERDLVRSAENLSFIVSNQLRLNRDALVAVAAQFDGQPAVDAAEWHRRLEGVQASLPDFLTLLVADADGALVGYAMEKEQATDDRSRLGLSVADRDYFQRARDQVEPFVGGVFQGRGFGNDLIVAVSVGAKDAEGKRWVLEGSLSLRELIKRLKASGTIQHRDVVLTDATNKVVVAAGELEVAALSTFHRFGPTRDLTRGRSVVRVAEPSRRHPTGEQFIMVAEPVAPFGWTVHLREPLWRTQEAIAQFYLAAGLAAGLAVVLVVIMGRTMAKRLTEGLRDIVDRAHAAFERAEAPALGRVGGDVPEEFSTIDLELQAAATRVAQSNEALAAAVAQARESNRQLQVFSEELEEKVKQRTAELEASRILAEQASRAKSEFLAAMSHELRTPLHVILGMNEVMSDQPSMTGEERESCHAAIDESGSHLLELINDILDISRVEAGRMGLTIEAVLLRSVCDTVIRMVRTQAEAKGLDLVLEYDLPNDFSLQADRRRLRQILLNLLTNAVKFTPEGGRVVLRATAAESGRAVRLAVADNGPGISAEDQTRLFQLFVQVGAPENRRPGGSGLGLVLAKRLVELHGGRVELDSEVGRGSTFLVEIPHSNTVTASQTPELSGEVREVRSMVAQLAPRQLRILIAEDSTPNIMVLKSYLKGVTAHLDEAANGSEALERVKLFRPDVILMDVQMPVMDGLAATSRLKADPATRSIPVIFLTAFAMPADRRRCEEAGGNGYLTKPLKLRLLLAEIQRVVS